MKNVIFLGCNTDQLGYLKEFVRRKINVIGFDKNSNAPGKKFCDYFHNIPYTNFKEIIKILNSYKINKNDYVFSAAQHHAFISIYEISKKFKIRKLDLRTIKVCLDKVKLSQNLKDNNIFYPKSFLVKSKNDLKKIKLKKNINYFLKSDYGKTPKYIFKFNKNDKPPKLPNKDQFFKKYFILQEEIKGIHYRLNIANDTIFVFKKINENKYISINTKELKFFKIIKKKIKRLIFNHNLHFHILKLDIIVSKNNWVVLDLGLDPPTRLLHQFISNKINFYKIFIDFVIFKKLSFKKYQNKLRRIQIIIKKNKILTKKI